MNKTELKERYNKFVSFSKSIEEGKVKNVFEAMIRRSDEAKELLKIIRGGCGNILDSNGDCMYVSSRGTNRYCNTCQKRIKFIREVLK